MTLYFLVKISPRATLGYMLGAQVKRGPPIVPMLVALLKLDNR